jgi:signal transduction histidine kinase
MNTKSEDTVQELAILAHELRGPLTSILFAVSCANEATHDESSSRQMCEIVERQARYLAGIIENVLEVSQVNHGKLSLHKELIDVRDIIELAAETNGPLLMKRRHSLKVSLPDERLLLMADPLRVQQVINNLLANACKYTKPGGYISVTGKTEGNVISIEVRDTGIGIPAEVLPRVFDLFQQGGDRCHCSFAGLGIGLALVRSLVELHGGSVTAFSKGPGTGSSFVVRLPGVVSICRENPDLLELPPTMRSINRANLA